MGMFTSGPRSLRLTGLESERRRRPRAFRPALGIERCEERVLLSLALVSASADGTTDGNGPSVLSSTSSPFGPNPGGPSGAISADGHLLVFASSATNLVSSGSGTSTAAPSANSANVYVRNTATGQTTLVSATPDGDPSNGDSFNPVISPDGRYVAFASTANDLTNKPLGLPQVGAPGWQGLLYVRDLQTQTTTLVDLGANGQAANGSVTGIYAFSPDSSTLAFFDSATNLTNTPVDSANAQGAAQPGQGFGPRGMISTHSTWRRGRPQPSPSRPRDSSHRATRSGATPWTSARTALSSPSPSVRPTCFLVRGVIQRRQRTPSRTPSRTSSPGLVRAQYQAYLSPTWQPARRGS